MRHRLVRLRLPSRSPTRAINFFRGLSLLPSHASTAHLPVSEFRQAFNRVLRYPDRLNQFGESAGNLELRQLICDKSFLLGASQPPREVLIVPGSQYGSLLLAMTVRRERTCYFGEPYRVCP